MYKSGPGKKTVLVLLVAFIALSFLSCSTAQKQIYNHETSDYLKLGSVEADKLIQDYLTVGDILPVEKVGNELCILKKNYFQEQRSIEDIKYAGIIIYYDRLQRLDQQRIHGLKHDRSITAKASRIFEKLDGRPSVENGFVLFLENFETMTDEQADMFAASDFKCLMLKNLAYITKDQAEVFSTFKGKSLCLNGLLWMSKEQTDALAEFKGDYLSLNNLHVITLDQIKALCRFHGKKIYLHGLYAESRNLVKEYQSESIAALVF